MSISPRFLLAGALMFVTASPSLVHAQPIASLAGAPIPENNGFDLFLQANKLYEGGLGNASSLTGTDLLRFQRSTVARNRAALRKFHEGLASPVMHPKVTRTEGDFGEYPEFRKLATLIKDESAVRYSDGDWVGALNASLDCIEFGVVITRGGPLKAAEAGRDIEEIGRSILAPIVSKLSIQECRDAAARLVKIETLRPPYADALRVEKNSAVDLTRESFEKLDWTDVVNDTKKPNGDSFTESEKSILNNSGEDEILANLSKVLDDAIVNADAVYKPVKPTVGRGSDPWSRMMTDSIAAPNNRVQYEAERAQNTMLKIALELRAEKMQTGKYPESIVLPLDPFLNPALATNTLKYRREGDSYLLYSVGPDTKDDNGKPIELEPNAELTYTTKGDLVGPVFS
ncbi:hypothetical protein EON80_03600 [bacterium]|nr:MAG: hypothetical protein EON80_03600 [bacterium]